MTDFTSIRILLADYPRLANINLSLVCRWIEEEADLEADILPVIRHWIARKPDIYSLGFFTPYVRKAKDGRLSKPKPLSIHDRARNIAFLIRKLSRSMPQESAWLERYEAEHGAVVLNDKTVADKNKT